MLLQEFNGGLFYNRLAPHLIPSSAGVVYNNIDNKSGILEPVKDKTPIGENVGRYFYKYKDEWISSDNIRDYLEYQEVLYWTDVSSYPIKYDGENEFRLGIVGPTTLKPITAIDGAGNLTGTYQYAVTFYNLNDGTESQPSLFSDDLEVTSESIRVSSLPVSTDPQVDKIKIYRLGGNLTAFSLVTTLDNGTLTYVDDTIDSEISGDILESYDYKEAPEGLRYLMESNGVLFGSVNDKLYFSEIGLPNAWPPLNFIDFPAVITGMNEISNGILVFLKYVTYMVVGSTPSTLIRDLVDSEQGCIDNRSIQKIKGSLIWVSSDGICSSNGGPAVVLSQNPLGKIELDISGSALHDSVYYALQTNGTILSFDMRFDQYLFKELVLDIDNIGSFDDILYGVKETELNTSFSSDDSLILNYKSPKFTEGFYTNEKIYKSIYLYCDGPLDINFYIDDELVLNKTLTTGFNEVKLPHNKQRGYVFQFEVSGYNKLLEVEYKVTGRQNNK